MSIEEIVVLTLCASTILLIIIDYIKEKINKRK